MASVGTFALLFASTAAFAATPANAAAKAASGCLNLSTPLTVEESRLTATLPQEDNPALLQAQPFARQMIDGAGFQSYTPALVNKLCKTKNRTAATKLVKQTGEQLWTAAVKRAQNKGKIVGNLPYSDDRPLYWTRLSLTASVREWKPGFKLAKKDRTALITTLDRASRGMFDIDFPTGKNVRRVIQSGFDPYTLDGGQTGTAAGGVGNNIRHGNPSGAIALSLDGTSYKAPDGKTVHIETYTLPVNYPEFRAGYLEDTVGPFMKPGPRQVSASVTVSQAGGSVFNLEQWNGRYHGVSLGNDNFAPCPTQNGTPQLAIFNHECNSMVVNRWGGPKKFNLNNPPQWTTTTLPVAQMIEANTGADVPRPPGDTWPDQSVAFGVVWHTNYTEFPDCTSTERVTRNSPPPTEFPPATQPIAPDPGSCSYSGGGGNYLSNESAYRNTLLRDRLGLSIPAGHIHTPGMQNFSTTFAPSDDTFNAWRLAIVAQAQNLIRAVADNS
jgi:hypothetical protein